ncbi:hypothetical protein LJC59_00890 [Desulfovibrio sp. OttesenSCG-928-A18]|nr:hypothetical protein [Desulfovibrio sp. OttesenSCG-928-A18]
MTRFDLNLAQDTARLAREELAKARALEQEICAAVLAVNEYFDEDTGERITEPARDYTMPEDQFTVYLEQCNAEYAKRGIYKEADACYCYRFEHALRIAEDVLIDVCSAIAPPDVQEVLPELRTHWKYRYELIDLNLRLAL